MQIIQENVDKLNAILKLKVKKEDYEPKIVQSLNSYRKKVDLKGFRKGQVPMAVVKKMYGNHIVADTINDLLNEQVNNYIVENKIDVLGNPLPKEGQTFDIEITSIKDFDFDYEIGLAPEFDLSLLNKKPNFERSVVDITPAMLDEEVDRLRKRYGKVEDVVDNMQDDDMITLKFEELDSNGNLVEGGMNHTTPIALDMLKDKVAYEACKKLKINESFVINDLVKAFEKDATELAKQILNLDAAPESLPSVQATLKAVRRVMPAELSPEFFASIYHDGSITTEAEMRSKIESEIALYFDKQADVKLYNKLAEELIEKTEMNFPDAFLKRWIKLTNEKPISEEQIEKEYPAFAKNLKWSLIIKKVSRDNQIDVSMDEVKLRTEEQIRQQMLSYGISEMPDEEMSKFVANMMARKDHATQTRETLLEEKLFDYFKAQIAVNDKKISLEEFYKQ